MATFTGNMVALFAVDKTSLPFNTKEELVDRVESQGYHILMDSSSNTRTLFIQVMLNINDNQIKICLNHCNNA